MHMHTSCQLTRRLWRRMKLAVLPIPPGAQALTAYLIVKNAGDAIPFCKKAFEAKELMRIETPRGTVGHTE